MGEAKDSEKLGNKTAITDGGNAATAKAKSKSGKASREIGGPKGLEPTRYGDWERKGICVDF